MEKWQKREIIAREYEEEGIYNAVTIGKCYREHVLMHAIIAARSIAPHILEEQVCVTNGTGMFWYTRKWCAEKVWWHLDNRMRYVVVLELGIAPYEEIAMWGGQTRPRKPLLHQFVQWQKRT